MNRFTISGSLALVMVCQPSLAIDEAAIREAVAKSLPLLERSSITAIEERPNCFTCHHTGLPLMAFITARDRGLKLDEENLRAQLQFSAAFLAKNRANYLAGKGQGGGALTAGSALCALDAGGWKSDATTDAVAEYLLINQKNADHWKPQSIRPPSEESPFGSTFAALMGLKKFGTPAQIERIAQRNSQVRSWLVKTPAMNTEDRVFKLWSLVVVESGADAIRQAAEELRETQRKDGGWSQLEDMASDAYATGTALVALHRAGGLPTTDPTYAKGLRWLIKAQLPDGSWHVRTRSKPIQSYFESGYPHGKDQFISITAACWSTTALTLALPAPR